MDFLGAGLQELDDTVQQREEILKGSQNRQADTLSQINAISRSDPLTRFPPEIGSKILEHFVPQRDDHRYWQIPPNYYDDHFNMKEGESEADAWKRIRLQRAYEDFPPLPIILVSRTWSRVAHASPALWETLYLRWRRVRPSAAMDFYVRHAPQHVRFAVILVGDMGPDMWQDPNFPSWLNGTHHKFRLYRDRFRGFAMRGDMYTEGQHLCSIITGFTKLEDLELLVNATPFCSRMAWKHADCLGFLQQHAPSLQSLKMTMAVAGPLSIDHPAVTFPRVRTFHMCVRGSEDKESAILPCLRMPALERIVLERMPWYMPSLFTFLSQHASTLRSLTVTCDWLYLVDILPLLPSLTELSLTSLYGDERGFDDDDERYLDADLDVLRPFVPALRHFSFQSEVAMSDLALLRFLIPRIGTLRTVKLTGYAQSLHPDTLKVLELYAAMGMAISLPLARTWDGVTGSWESCFESWSNSIWSESVKYDE